MPSGSKRLEGNSKVGKVTSAPSRDNGHFTLLAGGEARALSGKTWWAGRDLGHLMLTAVDLSSWVCKGLLRPAKDIAGFDGNVGDCGGINGHGWDIARLWREGL